MSFIYNYMQNISDLLDSRIDIEVHIFDMHLKSILKSFAGDNFINSFAIRYLTAA